MKNIIPVAGANKIPTVVSSNDSLFPNTYSPIKLAITGVNKDIATETPKPKMNRRYFKNRE